ncbi:MAG: ABC transporter permease [FCB group bacterium]|nr:ABC transporter permease [FCB group bacterium]
MRFLRLADRNMKEIYRDPVSMLLGLFMPLVMLFLFSSMFKLAEVDTFSPINLTPGVIIFSFSLIIMFSAVLLARDRQSAFLIRLFTTPLTAWDYILAYVLPFIPFALMQTLVCLLVGTLLGAVYQQITIAILVFLLMAFLCVSIGMIMGSLLTENQVSAVGSLFVVIISLFSGAWMDLKMVGGLFEKIGYALPFAHAVDVARAVFGGAAFTDISRSFYVVLIYTIGLFLLAVVSFLYAKRKK